MIWRCLHLDLWDEPLPHHQSVQSFGIKWVKVTEKEIKT
jgi:hypothetical protein